MRYECSNITWEGYHSLRKLQLKYRITLHEGGAASVGGINSSCLLVIEKGM